MDDLHTEVSNKSVKELGEWDYGDHNHFSDILDIVEALPSGIDVVFNRTEHWRTDPELFDSLEEKVEAAGGEFNRHGSHVAFEHTGNRAAVINSVEVSVEREDYHFIVGGLPLDDSSTYYNLSVEELLELAEKAHWCSAAHAFAPNFKIPDRILMEFYRKSADRDVRRGIGYMTGYTPLLNRLTHGRYKKLHNLIYSFFELRNPLREIFSPNKERKYSIFDYSRHFNVPLIPEMDMHTLIPERLEGCGVLKSDAMESLREGKIPVTQIMDAKVLSFSGIEKEGGSWLEFFQNFPGVLPLYSTGIFSWLLPYVREDFRALREESLKSLNSLSEKEIKENCYSPIEAYSS